MLSRRTLLLAPPFLLYASHVQAESKPRIVSIGGAVTEILYRLGHADDIVGVDSTSLYPTDVLKTKTNVGYVRALGAEGILSLNPSLIIANDGAGPPDALRLIGQAGVPIVRVPDEPSPAGIGHRVEIISQAVGEAEKGSALRAEIEQGFTQLAAARVKVAHPARTLFVLSLQNGRPLVGGKGTTADAMLTLAGAANVASSFTGWKPLSDEGLIAAAPEAIVMMDRGPTDAADLFSYPAFAATPAAARRRLIVMDSLYLLGFGPRTPSAAQDLLMALHADQLGSAQP